jgi:hypothetical protein
LFDLDPFFRAARRFAEDLGDVGWGYLALALALSLALQLCRAHAWANSLRAAYPDSRFRERDVGAAFLIGAGLNGVLPAKGGEAIKIVLAKRSVPGSSYPAIISSFAVLAPFDSGAGLLVLLYAITQGLLPRLPEIPDLPAFEISFWVENPEFLMFTLTVLALGVIVLFVFLARRVEAFWALAGGRLDVPVRLILAVPRRVSHRWLRRERPSRHERAGDRRRAAVHARRGRRAAGAPRRDPQRPLTRGGAGLLGRSAGGGHRVVARYRDRGDGLHLPNARLARSDPRGPVGARDRRLGINSSRTRPGSACP